MPVVLRAAQKATVRRAPSLEENLENTTCLNIPLMATSRNESLSSRSSILKQSPSLSPRVVTFEEKGSGSQRRDAPAITGDVGVGAGVAVLALCGAEEGKRSETVVKVESINNNLCSSMSKKTTEPIPSSRKSLLVRNEITSTPVTSFDPSEKFYNSIITAEAGLTSTSSNNHGENSCSNNSNDSGGNGQSSSNNNSSSSTHSARQITMASSSFGNTKINTNFPGLSATVQQHQQKSCNDTATTTIPNQTCSTPPIPAPTASSVLSSEIIEVNNCATVVANNIILTSSDPKLRLNPNRAAKLAKVLSVVEESPKMGRKYEISSPNPV